MILTEAQLESFALCPLRAATPNSDVAQTADKTLVWAIRESYLGQVPTLVETREYFATLWSERKPKPRRNRYWDGLRSGRTVAKRIHDVVQAHEIRQPVTLYQVVVEGQTITGSYALLQGVSREASLLVLNTCMIRSQEAHRPTLTGLARWLDARRNSPLARRVLIYNVPLHCGSSWKQDVMHEKLVISWLGHAVRQARLGLVYPVPSDACETCAHPCQQVFQD